MLLEKLGYSKKTDGFVLCDDESQAKNKVEWLYLKECEKFPVKPAAIFFRRFYKDDETEKPYHSEPAVCIFEVDNFFDSELHKKLHAALWSAGQNEIYILKSSTRLDILNARKPAVKSDNDVTLDDDDLLLVAKSLEKYDAFKYSTHLFQSGLFWEQPDLKSRIEGNSSPYEFLLEHLLQARKQIHKELVQLKLSTQIGDKLLIISILVKFLEEIKVDKQKHTLNEIYDKHNIQSHSFVEAIQNHKIFDILDELSSTFNGKVFNQFSDAERKSIESIDLKSLSDFLSADVAIPSRQLFIWKQYDFKFLPAEVISSIYESFTGANDANVVYTPIHLVNLMIDEVMPLDNADLFINEDFKVLDPACGSGIFLVAAYKRLLQWWIINNNKPINSEKAKQILEGNIFGVDIEETAVLVSIFSLTTTLLDRLSPKEIWNNLEFKDLSKKNIQETNFKDWISENKEDKNSTEKAFDLVIGNPPFKNNEEKGISEREFKKLFDKTIPGNKLSLMFLESALYFGKKVCMVIPSNVFLYNKASTNQAYRERIFTDYTVEKIYDFTHLRRVLFHKTADTPVLSLIINNEISEYQPIEHIVVKRAFQSEEKMRFEIDDYDRHLVPWQHAIDEAKHFVWKTNLLGGGQLFHLIYRLSLLRTLKVFIDDKKNDNWEYKNGYIGQYGDIDDNEQADFLNGKYTIKPRTFKQNGTFQKELISDNKYFWSIRNKELFSRPLIVFQLIAKKKATRLPVAFVEDGICFNSSFVGISSPFEDKSELYKVYDYLFKNDNTSKLSTFYMLCNSPKAMIYHETSLIKEDIDNLPFPKNQDYLLLSKTEKLIQNDVLNYYRHLGKSPKDHGKVLFEPITKKDPQLEQFGETYCEAMNEIYETETQNWQVGTITQIPNFTIYRIGFGKKNGLKYQYKEEETDNVVSRLIYNDLQNTGVRFTRVVRYYENENGYDFVCFIKPNARKYWLNSIALRDVGDTYMDLKKGGY